VAKIIFAGRHRIINHIHDAPRRAASHPLRLLTTADARDKVTVMPTGHRLMGIMS